MNLILELAILACMMSGNWTQAVFLFLIFMWMGKQAKEKQ